MKYDSLLFEGFVLLMTVTEVQRHNCVEPGRCSGPPHWALESGPVAPVGQIESAASGRGRGRRELREIRGRWQTRGHRGHPGHRTTATDLYPFMTLCTILIFVARFIAVPEFCAEALSGVAQKSPKIVGAPFFCTKTYIITTMQSVGFSPEMSEV